MINMSKLKELYNLENDSRQIKIIQDASLDKKSYAGFKIEDDLLFGTKDWFEAIKNGKIKKYIICGKISKISSSGHNDYPEFEIKNDRGVTVWARGGIDSLYQLGQYVELTYVEQKYKRPSDITGKIYKCVIQIKVEV